MEIYISLAALWAPLFLLASLSNARLNAPTFRLENPTLSILSQRLSKSPCFNITAGIEGRNETLAFALENNGDIADVDSHVQYLDVQGSVRHAEPLTASMYAVTKGSLWMQRASHRSRTKVGWARIVILQGGENPSFEGTFSVRSEVYEIRIQSPEDDSAHDQLVAHLTSATGLSKPSNELQLQEPTCMMNPASSPYKRRDSGGENSLTDTIGNTYGCPNSTRLAYIGVATDCTYTAHFNSTEAVRRTILNFVNTAAVVFENSFNITLGLRNVTISDPTCPSSISSASQWNSECSNGDLNWRLREFSFWRSYINDSNAYWTLLTGCEGTSGKAGISWIGQLCNGYGSWPPSIGANIVGGTPTEWQVFAHESAHTFGAIHDCDSSTCASGASEENSCCPLSSTTCSADGQYLMDPVVGQGMTRFSACTIGSVCSKIRLGDVSTSCLVSANKADHGNGTVINHSVCGNGVVEAGEDCDCGRDNCSDEEAQCCDPMTCQWKGGSHCAKVSGNNDGEEESSWVSRHLDLVIGLSVGIGGALVLAALVAIIVCCRIRKKRAQAKETSLPVDERRDEAGLLVRAEDAR